MDDARGRLDRAEIEAFIAALAFVREYAIQFVSLVPGEVVIELPFDARFSGPPGQFPASLVGTAGDVAATLDFTIKMTGVAAGEKLRAKGRVLQAGRTNSVGAADVYVVAAGRETRCGAVLATTRNFQIKPPAVSRHSGVVR